MHFEKLLFQIHEKNLEVANSQYLKGWNCVCERLSCCLNVHWLGRFASNLNTTVTNINLLANSNTPRAVF